MLIGLTGYKEVGKDTVYSRIHRLWSSTFKVERVAFADLLYESAAAAIGVTVSDLKQWKSDPKVKLCLYTEQHVCIHSLTIREYLQKYGKEAHRDIFDPGIWEEPVEYAISQHQGKLVVVTDVRLRTEAELIHNYAGWLVKVVDDRRENSDSHLTERPLPEDVIDRTIYNLEKNGDFTNLDMQVDRIIALMLTKEGVVK